MQDCGKGSGNWRVNNVPFQTRKKSHALCNVFLHLFDAKTLTDNGGRMIKTIALSILALLLNAGVCTAGDSYDAHFPDMDTNGDAQVVKEEFTAYFKDNSKPDEAFAIIDADKSGGIDHDEWHAFKNAHGYGHKEGMKHMDGKPHMEGMPHMEGSKP